MAIAMTDVGRKADIHPLPTAASIGTNDNALRHSLLDAANGNRVVQDVVHDGEDEIDGDVDLGVGDAFSKTDQ